MRKFTMHVVSEPHILSISVMSIFIYLIIIYKRQKIFDLNWQNVCHRRLSLRA